MSNATVNEAASPLPGRPKAGSIPSGDRARYAATEGPT